LLPGGWIEIQDAPWQVDSDDGSSSGSALETFFYKIRVGADALNRDVMKTKVYKDYLHDAGFVDIVEHRVPLPLSRWPTHPLWYTVSRYAREER
jgi:hypothetical protein